MFNQTIEKFGYPNTLVREFDHWVVLVRSQQVTAGSLILAAKSSATAYSDLAREAFVEQREAIFEIERTLRQAIAYERINYLMLMMVDPNVHFHVIPRYAGTRQFAGLDLTDSGWPGPPDLKSATALDDSTIEQVRGTLRAAWKPNSD